MLFYLKAIAISCSLMLVGGGCNTVGDMYRQTVNPNSTVLEEGQSEVEAPPIVGQVIVEQLSIISATLSDPVTGFPNLSIGRKRVIVQGGRGTTQADSVEAHADDEVNIINDQAVTTGVGVSVNPTE